MDIPFPVRAKEIFAGPHPKRRAFSLAKAADLILSQGAETFHFGSRFWLLFVIIAILHCLGRRREKKQAAARKASVQPGGPDETPEVPASPENSDENREA